MARLKDYYKAEVAPALMKKFSYKSPMQIPKLEKVVINVGAGDAKDNTKVIDAISADLAAITGQRPVVCKAKKSVANFKLREGMNIGVKVTLRGDRMYEFIDRFFNIALPRVRDFRGIKDVYKRQSTMRPVKSMQSPSNRTTSRAVSDGGWTRFIIALIRIISSLGENGLTT